jgi:hypothetical protein
MRKVTDEEALERVVYELVELLGFNSRLVLTSKAVTLDLIRRLHEQKRCGN